MKATVSALGVLLAGAAFAEETRGLDAHEHGVGELNIALDGTTVAMELHAPGADIVGFEYEAESAEDRAAVDAAVAVLAKPLDLFVLPASAECSVVQASAGLEAHDEDEHDDHGHEDHADHDDHGHDDQGHEDHADHNDHDEHGHDDHAEAEARHSEFHAEYQLTCANPNALSGIDFAYFATFENARELEVQVVTASGAQAFEVTRDAPSLDLRGLF